MATIIKITKANVRLHVAPAGIDSKVEIRDPQDENRWIDISRWVVGISVQAHVGDITTIQIELSGIAEIEVIGVVGELAVFQNPVAKEERNPGSETE